MDNSIAKRLEKLDLSIESIETLMAEHESDPTSEDYKASIEAYQTLMTVRNELVETDIKREETLRKLENQERELNAKIEEQEARIELDWWKAVLAVGGAGAAILLVDFLESKGHLIRDTGVKLFTSGVRAITAKL